MTYSFAKKGTNGSLSLGFLAFAAALYSAGYAFELTASNLDDILFFNSIQYVGIPFFGALLLIFSIQVTRRKDKIKFFQAAVLLVIPIVTCFIRGTIHIHDLFYINPHIVEFDSFNVLKFDKGIWYYISALYTLICVLLACMIFLRETLKSRGNQQIQSMIMIFAIFPAAILALITNLGFNNMIDLTPFGFIFSTAILLIGLYKFHILNPVSFVRRKAFGWSESAMIVLNKDYDVLDMNDKAIEIFDVKKMQITGKNITDTIDKNNEIIRSIHTGNTYTREIKRGELILKYQIKSSILYDIKPNIIGYLIMMNDITAYENAIEEMREIISKDSLTGVLARRHFDERVVHEIKRAKRKKTPMAMMIFDLDKFKYINDNFGHPAGDTILVEIARICQKSVRQIDFIGRMGGDEFVILLPETLKEDAEMIAERIRTKIDELRITFDEIVVGITISIGIAFVSIVDSDITLNTLYKHADIALYKAKDKGRNCIVMDEL